MTTATKNRSENEMIWDFIELNTDLNSYENNPRFHFMDNKA